MCDCLCAVRSDGALFAKSSDRPPTEPQIIEATHRATTPVLGARPVWLDGFEHGVNGHRVAVGNEQLWTIDRPVVEPGGLTGMDIVRAALEQATSAAEAVDVIVGLVERRGQGGAGEQAADGTAKAYSSSFLVADPSGAWVVETSGRSWAARPVGGAGSSAAVSNRISLSTDFTRASADVTAAGDFDRWRRQESPTEHADKRLAVTRPAAAGAAAGQLGPREVAAVLRHHGRGPWGEPGGDTAAAVGLPPAVVDRRGTGVSLCLHLTGVQATTSSMITWLPVDPAEPARGWVAPGSPCTSIFVPTFGTDGIAPELARSTTWERFRVLRDRVERARSAGSGDGTDELGAIREVLAPVEAELWDEADVRAGQDPAEAEAWARSLWPRLDAALVALGA